MIGIIYIIFGLVKEKVSLKLGGGLSQCYIHAPIMSSQEKLLFKKFYARLSLNNRSMLDTSCTGSFMMKTIEFKWDLLEIIKCNSEDWDLDNGKESGIHLVLIVLNLLWIPMFSIVTSDNKFQHVI